MKLPPAHRVIHLDSVDSTSLEARRLADQGEQGPLWIWADEQTAGRGRLGRAWQSPPGNLHATFLWLAGASPADAAQIGFVAALAAHDAVSALRPGADLVLKWPNDVLLEGGKLCGLLAEVVQPLPLLVAMGFGVNLAHSPEGLPYKASGLGDSVKPLQLLEHLAAAFAARLAQWNAGLNFAAIRSEWCARSIAPGTQLSVDGRTGRFAGLGESGALLLEEQGRGIVTINAGDVRLAEAST